MKGFAMKGMLTVALCWSLLFTACQNEDSAGDESDTAMEQVQAPSVDASGGADTNAGGNGSGNAANADTSADSSGTNADANGGSGDSASTAGADSSDIGTVGDDNGNGGSDSETNPTMSGGRLVQRDVTTWNGVTVGDVILRDGSRVSAASLADGINSDNPPVAVVAYFVDGGYVAVGMPSEELAWTASDNADATKKFTAVASNKIPTDDGYDFTGVVDGSTSWQKLCDCDATGIEDVALHYPAFFYAKNYASENRISGDWYVPSIAELYEVYVNHDCINSSLKAIGQTELTKMYWSSSLYETKQHETNSAWYLNFKTLKKPYYTVAYESKTKSHSVLPIRVFTDDSSAQ